MGESTCEGTGACNFTVERVDISRDVRNLNEDLVQERSQKAFRYGMERTMAMWRNEVAEAVARSWGGGKLAPGSRTELMSSPLAEKVRLGEVEAGRQGQETVTLEEFEEGGIVEENTYALIVL